MIKFTKTDGDVKVHIVVDKVYPVAGIGIAVQDLSEKIAQSLMELSGNMATHDEASIDHEFLNTSLKRKRALDDEEQEDTE